MFNTRIIFISVQLRLRNGLRDVFVKLSCAVFVVLILKFLQFWLKNSKCVETTSFSIDLKLQDPVNKLLNTNEQYENEIKLMKIVTLIILQFYLSNKICVIVCNSNSNNY